MELSLTKRIKIFRGLSITSMILAIFATAISFTYIIVILNLFGVQPSPTSDFIIYVLGGAFLLSERIIPIFSLIACFVGFIMGHVAYSFSKELFELQAVNPNFPQIAKIVSINGLIVGMLPILFVLTVLLAMIVFVLLTFGLMCLSWVWRRARRNLFGR
ncbi:MAG: hypothetical protein ACTSRD_10370 [Promethearchaeota archaeon]